jgi:hypothetical protein
VNLDVVHDHARRRVPVRDDTEQLTDGGNADRSGPLLAFDQEALIHTVSTDPRVAKSVTTPSRGLRQGTMKNMKAIDGL